MSVFRVDLSNCEQTAHPRSKHPYLLPVPFLLRLKQNYALESCNFFLLLAEFPKLNLMSTSALLSRPRQILTSATWHLPGSELNSLQSLQNDVTWHKSVGHSQQCEIPASHRRHSYSWSPSGACREDHSISALGRSWPTRCVKLRDKRVQRGQQQRRIAHHRFLFPTSLQCHTGRSKSKQFKAFFFL